MLTHANMGYLVGWSNANVSTTCFDKWRAFQSFSFKIRFEEDRIFKWQISVLIQVSKMLSRTSVPSLIEFADFLLVIVNFYYTYVKKR